MRIHGVVLAVGFLVGVLGDALFHGATLGLNLSLWLAALLLAGWWLRRRNADGNTVLPWLLGLTLLFAGFLAWRASPFLRFWNGAAVLGAAVLIGVRLRGRIASAWPRDYVRGAVDLAVHLAGGVGAAAGEIRWPGGRVEASASRGRAVRIGIALAVPVIFVFGGLLTSADPVLDAFVARLFDWDLGLVFEHVLLVLLLGWIAAGWLRSVTARRAPSDGSPPPPPRTFALIEIAIPLGALTMLLAAFIGIQARYLFGGETIVQSTGLTYATFARRGFFELVFVSALVVPLLFIAQWVLDRGTRHSVESFRALVVGLSVLIGLVMVSALARMRLYVAAYGLTEDRLYATAFMAWIGWVLLWFVLTELRAQPGRFATGSLLAGFVVLAALNVLNPDALIARVNIARAGSRTEFDAEYLGRLSVDAVPAVVAAWSELDVDARCALRGSLISRVQPNEDWREWTWATAVAARVAGRLPAGRCP